MVNKVYTPAGKRQAMFQASLNNPIAGRGRLW
jgi:hypothetical protein